MKQYGFVLLAFLWAINVSAQAPLAGSLKYKDLALDFETRALDLVQHMSLDEKISQLGNTSPAIPRLGVSEYDWWNECLHGVARAGTATVFPQAIGMAATFNRNLMKQVADVISDEARAKHHEALRNNDYGRYKGLTFWSPNINIFRDPRWGRGHETYGEDPYLTGQLGMQFVRGLQGDDEKYLKLVATAKHFAVHNGPEGLRHSFNVVPNARDLWETYLPAFKDLMVDAKAYSIMGAYNRVDGESASASWLLLQDILRKKWGFEGYVVSDCGAINDIHAHHKIVNTAEESAAVGVRKGCDLNCGRVYQRALKNAVEQGLIDEGEIDLSVYRLMLARMKLGMFDPADIVPYAQIPYQVNNSAEHDALALKMAQESMTLLKNDGILPLNKKKVKRIAVVGPNAENIEALRANYYGIATNPVTVIDGIRKAVDPKTNITYSQGVPLVKYQDEKNMVVAVDSKYLFTTDKSGKKVSGLTAEYFNNKELLGEAVFTRNDPKIAFSWSGSPTQTEVAQGILEPDKAIGDDNFSIRWTGKLLAPETGKFKLGVASDDGSRLWVNGKLIADGWSDHALQSFFGDIELEAGKTYDIKLEYYENTQGAAVTFAWETPSSKAVKAGNTDVKLAQSVLDDVRKADVAIFVGGLDATWEGEEMRDRVNIDGFNRGDRTKIELPKIQQDAIQAMLETGTPVVLVLMSGSAVAFDGLDKKLQAIVLGWYPGQRGGDAIADVLFGNYNPAGRLPVTFYSSTDELADFTDYNMRAGKGFTYRYYQGEALYPFGHGLSYTNFKYSNLKIDKTKICDSDEFSVSVNIANTGKMDGDEVVQLYVKDVKSDIWMPIKQLRKFERITVKKGQEETIEFKLNAKEDLRYYNSMYGRYMVEPGDFEIQIGASSNDIRLKALITVE